MKGGEYNSPNRKSREQKKLEMFYIDSFIVKIIISSTSQKLKNRYGVDQFKSDTMIIRHVALLQHIYLST